MKSITQETTLDEFFHTANLSNADFTSRLFFCGNDCVLEKLDVRILSKAALIGSISQTEMKRRTGFIDKNKAALHVLKRFANFPMTS